MDGLSPILPQTIQQKEFPLQNTSLYQRNRGGIKGPLRVVKLCFLGILLPALLLAVPLYMRYRVYGQQLYPLALSDMRLLDSKVSTTWCQKQLVKVNATFNAFLLPETPKLSAERKILSMVREFYLEDDSKEYWGFYLLKGSSVTVSTCVRWPGASLIIIRGHKHLHECAYIGDDSSEEIEEMMEAIAEKGINKTLKERQPVNQPDKMKRHRADVEFHSPIHQTTNNKKSTLDEKKVDSSEETTDPGTLKKILEALKEKIINEKKINGKKKKHVHRNSTIAKGETENIQIEINDDSKNSDSHNKSDSNEEDVVEDILNKLNKMGGDRGGKVLEKINEKFHPALDMHGRHYSKPLVDYGDNIDLERSRRKKRELILKTAMKNNEHDEENDLGIEEEFISDGIADHRGTINETTLNDMSNSEFWSSFSSSEEALLNCAGLILNLPLTPHSKCNIHSNDKDSYLDNTITYKVPVNGYYFFVFNSENEVNKNFIRVQFDLNKVTYDITNPVAYCKNSSHKCEIPLNFFSSEKLVMELPVNDNETHLWNEEFIVLSECEPRMAIYAVCLVAVPVLVAVFAFA